MSELDDEMKGYVAIGEAVITHIYRNEKISQQSLMKMLTRDAEEENNDEKIVNIMSGRRILQSAQEVSQQINPKSAEHNSWGESDTPFLDTPAHHASSDKAKR